MKPLIVMIGGWAHPAGALQPLTDAVREFADPQLVAVHEPLPAPERPAFLLGWSLGGMFALREALTTTARWLGLILISSCARFCAAPDYPHGIAPARVRAMKAALRKSPAAVLRQFFADAAAPHLVPPAALEEEVRAALALGPDALAAGLESLLALDLRSAAARCEKPTLLLHGRDDCVIPATAGEWLAGQLPFSRFTPVAGCGHDLPDRAPGLLAAEIKGFLETR